MFLSTVLLLIFQDFLQAELSYDLSLKIGNTTFPSAELTAYITLSMGHPPLPSFIYLKGAAAIE